MVVIVLSRWAAKLEDIQRIAARAKPLFERHGLQFEVCRIFSGSNTGQFLVFVRYTDWERFGRAMYALFKDTEYQQMLAEAHCVGELQERSIVVSLEEEVSGSPRGDETGRTLVFLTNQFGLPAVLRLC